MKKNDSKEFEFFEELTRSGGFTVSDSDVVKQWNQYRKAHEDKYLDLQGIHLDHHDDWYLPKMDLSRCNLHGAYFVQIPLDKARFVGSDLTKADMWGAHLTECNFEQAILRKADLFDAIAYKTNFERADLRRTKLHRAKLDNANFKSADLSRADLSNALLSGADFTNANLREANFTDAILPGAIFKSADLRGAKLTRASLERTIFRKADLSGASIYGAGVWNVDVDKTTKQKGLIITPEGESAVLVDDIEVAQFIYLLINRQKLRNVIDAVTRRGVLILGRFSDGGIEIHQLIADWLRQPENGNYLPLLFDFPRPETKTYTETIRTLAGLARFVIVDLSGPSVPQEITATVDLHEIPFVPILERKRKDWSMFKDFLVKERVLDPVRFTDAQELVSLLRKEIVIPAEKLIKKRQLRLDKIFGRG
jgi:uncharacterized protein YjbI with pentapeptide repeats